MRLDNRFFPHTHEKEDAEKKLLSRKYSYDYKEPILSKESQNFPLLALSSYCVLQGCIEEKKFKGWTNKHQTTSMKANVLYPESPLIEFILNSVNMFPDPEAILVRLINRLNDIKNKKVR